MHLLIYIISKRMKFIHLLIKEAKKMTNTIKTWKDLRNACKSPLSLEILDLPARRFKSGLISRKDLNFVQKKALEVVRATVGSALSEYGWEDVDEYISEDFELLMEGLDAKLYSLYTGEGA